MSLEIWIAFTLASAALLAIPGPTILLVVSYALGRGRASGWATVPGVALGDLTAMTISLLGAGAVLAASASLFSALKLAGAAYLIWLGIKMWRSHADPGHLRGIKTSQSNWAMLRTAYVVTALNPKSIVFFIAFVPQFIDSARAPLPQFSIMVATFVLMAAVNVALWAIMAGTMRARFERPETLRIANRIGGSFLIGAGFLTATLRRSA